MHNTAVYFDNSATTKPYPEVCETVARVMEQNYGNPSSTHSIGREAKKTLEAAREILATALGASSEEIVFTSGGTEADNLAIIGTHSFLVSSGMPSAIAVSTVEHAAVTKTSRSIRRTGGEVRHIPILQGGLDFETAEKVIDDSLGLVSIMLVNNETGTIFPIEKMRKLLNEKKSHAVLHTDAVQAFGKIPFTVDGLGVDLLSVSSHKIHGPKGVGALYVRKGTGIHPHMFGGGQERGLRSGTEAVPQIAGFAEAVRLTFNDSKAKLAHVRNLHDRCISGLFRELPEMELNSNIQGSPYIINFSLPEGMTGKDAVTFLEKHNIFVSQAAACKSNHTRGPSVLMSFGFDVGRSDRALRIGFSAMSTPDEVDLLIDCLKRYTEMRN